MLRSIKQIYGEQLGATDGDIGHVKDFYFDDRHWAIRYIVADTGSWISGRLVLISPLAFGSLHQIGKVLRINLTRQQIEESPPIESHKPVSRQFEEEYYQYYGWPFYWQGDGVWGMSGFPILTEKSKPFTGAPANEGQAKPGGGDAHLRSAQAVIGYQIQASDDIAGSVVDFLVDDESWAIGQLVVNTGNRFTGKKVLVSASQVDRISFDESKIFVSPDKATIMELPAYETADTSLAAGLF